MFYPESVKFKLHEPFREYNFGGAVGWVFSIFWMKMKMYNGPKVNRESEIFGKRIKLWWGDGENEERKIYLA